MHFLILIKSSLSYFLLLPLLSVSHSGNHCQIQYHEAFLSEHFCLHDDAVCHIIKQKSSQFEDAAYPVEALNLPKLIGKLPV